MDEIPTKDLTIEDVPGEYADFEDLRWFAHSLGGYRAAGSAKRCFEIARSPNPESLEELRIALFFEYRAQRHQGGVETDQWQQHIRDIVRNIRRLVAERDCKSVDPASPRTE